MTTSRQNNFLPRAMINDSTEFDCSADTSMVPFVTCTMEKVTSSSPIQLQQHSVYTIQCHSHAACTYTSTPHGVARPVGESQAVVLDKIPSCCTAVQHTA